MKIIHNAEEWNEAFADSRLFRGVSGWPLMRYGGLCDVEGLDYFWLGENGWEGVVVSLDYKLVLDEQDRAEAERIEKEIQQLRAHILAQS